MKHLLSTADVTRDDALLILDTATQLAQATSQGVGKLPPLRGRTVVNLFYEDSTRTRISFEVAEKRLSADVINFAAKGSSVSFMVFNAPLEAVRQIGDSYLQNAIFRWTPHSWECISLVSDQHFVTGWKIES